MIWPRARGLGDTYALACAAGVPAGVTRLADVGGLAGLGLPVFQAIRPRARSLTVSQGKGETRLAAKVSALLEACELACAENLPEPAEAVPLDALPEAARRCWSGDRPELTIDLDPKLPRGWVTGCVLGTDEPMPMPWDLLSLDFTRPALEYLANSDGLATGNTCEEAVLAALCELVEHHALAIFESLRPLARRARQVDASSVPEGQLARELRRVTSSGYTPRLWSISPANDVPVIVCKLFAPEPALDLMTPTGGSGCHPDAETAALAALREAVQGRAALVAGARDDIVAEDYLARRDRTRALAIATLAFTDGELDWQRIPTRRCTTVRAAVAVMRQVIARLTTLPVIVFDHLPPADGLHVVHALAPGLCNRSRRRVDPQPRRPLPARAKPPNAQAARAVLFAGPSLAGLTVPSDIAVRPPAVCGDLAGLLSEAPVAVGLVDGTFGLAPTVWHKEILELLSSGVRVLGAASIGAMRAAELADDGMEGVGAIYAAYRAKAIERDDAVMLLQGPAEYGFAPLSLALVDAEHTLAMVDCPPRERRMMQRIVRTMSYQTRTWPRCLEAYYSRTGRDFPVAADRLQPMPSLKQRDTALLITRLGEAIRAGPPSTHPLAPPLTNHYLRMMATRSEAPAPVPS